MRASLLDDFKVTLPVLCEPDIAFFFEPPELIMHRAPAFRAKPYPPRNLSLGGAMSMFLNELYRKVKNDLLSGGHKNFL